MQVFRYYSGMAQWKFQLCPHQKDVIGIGFRMDPIGQKVENEVNDALRYPFRFHGVNKIVVKLGKSPVDSPDYVEMAGVGVKQYPDFCAQSYLQKSDEERREELIQISKSVLGWFLHNFDDAEFARKAAERLEWELG